MTEAIPVREEWRASLERGTQGLAHTGGQRPALGGGRHLTTSVSPWGGAGGRAHVLAHGRACGRMPTARPEHSSPGPFFSLGAHGLVATGQAGLAALCCLLRLPKSLRHVGFWGADKTFRPQPNPMDPHGCECADCNSQDHFLAEAWSKHLTQTDSKSVTH